MFHRILLIDRMDVLFNALHSLYFDLTVTIDIFDIEIGKTLFAHYST